MMLDLKDHSTEPLHSRISTELAKQIIDGEMPAGAELPTITEFVREHRVSRDTVRKAYGDLALRGLIRTGRRSRFLVAPLEDDTRQAIALCRGMKQQPLLTAIESFSRDLLSVISQAKLCDMLAGNIRRFIGAGDVRIFLYDAGEGRYVEASSGGDDSGFTAGSDDGVIRALIESGEPVRLKRPEGEEPSSDLLEEIARLGARVALPLKDGNRLCGFVMLDARPGGGEYPGESLDLAMILAKQFVTALTTARLYVESVEKRRTEDELRIAQQIQADLLHEGRHLQGGFDIAAVSTPSRTVVGDFYDYFPIGETRLGLVIADTSGKGIPAAILISQIQATVKNDVGNGDTIRQTMRDLNSRMGNTASEGSSTTLFYGIVDRASGKLEFANAGHASPFLVRRNGEVTGLRSTGPAFGIASGPEHQTESIDIREGDCILLYTDGVTRSAASNGKQYGALRLKDLLIRNRHLDPGEIIQVIKNDLRTFSPGGLPEDDRTLLVARVNSVNP
jgi:serine phosphatase RsbU (regulator of sigma subunit)/DNA-binding transcriptional regulator YhcF (GntR family)